MKIVPAPTLDDDTLRRRMRSALVKARRRIMQLTRQRQGQQNAIERLKSQRDKLANNPFNRHRVTQLDEEITDRKETADGCTVLLSNLADVLIDCAESIDACTTLAERCDILNINPVDRAGLTEDDGLISLIWVHKLEDSAANRGKEWPEQPLFDVLHFPLFKRMMATPGMKEEAHLMTFGPGGPLEWVPMYKQAADGTMVRQPPPLRVAVQEDHRD